MSITIQKSNMRYSVACPLCLKKGMARIGLTKKGMPFVTCMGCASRSFLNSFEALRSISQTDPEVVEQLKRDREGALEAVAAETAYPLAQAGERKATTRKKSWVELLQLPSLDEAALQRELEDDG